MQEHGTVPSGPGAPDPPGASWRWPRLDAVRRAGGMVLAGAAVTGVLFDLAVRSGSVGLGAAATVWAAVAAVLASRLAGRWSSGCFACAAVLAAWLVLRASPWLVLPDLAAIGLLAAAGVLVGQDGSTFDLRWSTLGARALWLLPRLVWVPGFVVQPVTGLAGRVTRGRRSDVAALARGLAIALPIVVVFGLLLASADPVFASFFNAGSFSADPVDLLLHLVLVATGALLLGAIAGGLAVAYPGPTAGRMRLGSREALVVISVIDVLFALFAVAQVVAAMGGGTAALRSAGVSYSDYARSGFFQLLWVAGLSWIVVLAVRGAVPREPGWQRAALIASIEVAIGLVLLIVYVAHSRLQLYEVAYGFTLLRLYSHVFAGLAGAAFVLLGVAVAGVGSSRSWLLGAVGTLALVTLVGLDVANPEAVVFRLNVERAALTGKLDVDYLASLSADTTPLALSPGPGLQAEYRDALRVQVCAKEQPADAGWASYNVATRAAADARRSGCG